MKLQCENYRVLVTGACGVLGIKLCKALLNFGAEVVGFDLVEYRDTFTDLTKEHNSAEFIAGDLLEIKSIEGAIDTLSKNTDKDIVVFHLAGQSDANKCDEDPKMAFMVNITATGDLLEVCSKKGITRLLFPSSAYVYGTSCEGLITEEFQVKSPGLYPLTKLTGEILIRGYSEFADISSDIVRISNVYGPDSKQNTILGTIMDQADTKNSITLRDLSPVRDFIFIDDVIEGFIRLMVAGSEKGCRIFNLSTGLGTSVGELAHLYCRVSGKKINITQLGEADPKSISKLVLSHDRLWEHLQWKPPTTLEDGIKMIVREKEERKKHAKA